MNKKKLLYYILGFVAILIIIIFLILLPHSINSKLGTKKDFSTSLNRIKKEENINLIILEQNDYENEIKYEIYNKDKENYSKETSLGLITLNYDENDNLESLEYTFNPNYKSYKVLLKSLIKTSLIELTDKGYNVISSYLSIDKIDDSFNETKRYICSNKTLSLEYNKEQNTYIFRIK